MQNFHNQHTPKCQMMEKKLEVDEQIHQQHVDREDIMTCYSPMKQSGV